MKMITVSILAFIYLLVSSGVAFSIHYCMGKVTSVDLVNNSEKCEKCGMKLTPGCCKEEFKIVKLSDSHKLISNDIKIYAPVTHIDHRNIIFDTGVFLSCCPSLQKNYCYSPPPQQLSLNILNCVFRI